MHKLHHGSMFRLFAQCYFLFCVLISSMLQDEKRRLDDQIAQLKEELEEEQLNSEMSNERYKRSAQQVRTCWSLANDNFTLVYLKFWIEKRIHPTYLMAAEDLNHKWHRQVCTGLWAGAERWKELSSWGIYEDLQPLLQVLHYCPTAREKLYQ